MSIVPMNRPVGFFKISSYGMRNCHKLDTCTSLTAALNSRPTQSETNKKEEFSVENQKLSIPQSKTSPLNLNFNRLQPFDQEIIQEDRIGFGQFVAREALLDEEFWEFTALKRRCRKQQKHKCTCIVTVKKEDKNVKCTILKSVVGTLD
ncbi:hypothetical protein CsSME_00008836 [Camellia sinensis var. sinensis]